MSTDPRKPVKKSPDEKTPSAGRQGIAVSVYVPPALLREIDACAQHMELDRNKTMLQLLRRGFESPDLPDWCRAYFVDRAAQHGVSLSQVLSQTLILLVMERTGQQG